MSAPWNTVEGCIGVTIDGVTFVKLDDVRPMRKQIDEQADEIERLREALNDRMKMRDQFAAAALPAILVNKGLQIFVTAEAAAETAYQVADAMMKARAALGEGK